MTIVVDTNVVLSGTFFGGRPAAVLGACIDGTVTLAASPEIWDEFHRAGRELARSHPTPLLEATLAALASCATHVEASRFEAHVCRDPKDDMFVACALAAGADCLVTGDRDLLVLDGKLPFPVFRPADFIAFLRARRTRE